MEVATKKNCTRYYYESWVAQVCSNYRAVVVTIFTIYRCVVLS